MIKRLGFRNFLSFDQGVECSFESSDGKSVNTLLNVKGANGSGKSNFLKAISFFMNFVANSFGLKPEDTTGVTPFFQSQEPSYFFVEFTTDEASESYDYLYELELLPERVVSEKLSRKKLKYTECVVRKDNTITKAISDFAEIKTMKLRTNASLVSSAHQYEIEAFSNIYLIFLRVLDSSDPSATSFFLRGSQRSLEGLTKTYHDNADFFNDIKKFITQCDLGIDDIHLLPETLANGEEIYTPIFIHKNQDKEYPLRFQNESSGTKYLYYNLRFFLITTQYPTCLLLFDELDMSLHPDIVKKIIALFEERKQQNLPCGQMIFTAHNTNIMDALKADQVFLLNKEDNESFGYRVDECPSSLVRKDRGIRLPYEQGRIGGVPKL